MKVVEELESYKRKIEREDERKKKMKKYKDINRKYNLIEMWKIYIQFRRIKI